MTSRSIKVMGKVLSMMRFAFIRKDVFRVLNSRNPIKFKSIYINWRKLKRPERKLRKRWKKKYKRPKR